jgi:two-component system chemotaxis response regulator CheB
MQPIDVVAIGVSAGGMKALATLLAHLPKDYSVPIIIVQHLLEGSESFLVEYLNDMVPIHIQEAIDKEPLRPGCVFLAPPGYHLLVEDGCSLSLSMDPKVNYSRPSIDVLFDSAAFVFQEKCLGIILTGANQDGSAGLRTIKANGGMTIVQCPETAEYPAMPLAAIQHVAVDHIMSLDEIGEFLITLQRARP